jgi:hypothetical protein
MATGRPKPELPVYSVNTKNIIHNNVFYIKSDIKHKDVTKR